MSSRRHTKTGHLPECPALLDLGDCCCERTRYKKMLFVGCAILLVEVCAGYISGSLAILTDAAHLFTDIVSDAVALLVSHLALLSRSHERESRVRSIGGYVQASLLALLGVLICIEGFERLNSLHEVNPHFMIVVGIIAALGNYIRHKILHTGSTHAHAHVTHWAQKFHVLTDLGYSIVVLLGDIAIAVTGNYLFDVYASFGMVAVAWILSCIIVKLSFQEKKNPP